MRRIRRRFEYVRGARTGADRQRQGLHRALRPSSGRSPLRPHLPGERDRPPFDPARSPTTTGKIERFHRTLRDEFDTTRVFSSLKVAQQALDEWVTYYNTERAHQSLGDCTPVSRFQASERQVRPRPERNGDHWVTRRIARNGVISVGYQQVSVGKNYSGSPCDVLVTDQVLQCWVGNELLRTVARATKGDIRKKHADGTAPRRYAANLISPGM